MPRRQLLELELLNRNQQIQQLTHEIQMLENMARDLETLPDSIADDILRRMRRIDGLMRDAEGIGYRVEEIEHDYEEAYPDVSAARTKQPRQNKIFASSWFSSGTFASIQKYTCRA